MIEYKIEHKNPFNGLPGKILFLSTFSDLFFNLFLIFQPEMLLKAFPLNREALIIPDYVSPLLVILVRVLSGLFISHCIN